MNYTGKILVLKGQEGSEEEALWIKSHDIIGHIIAKSKNFWSLIMQNSLYLWLCTLYP